MVDVVIDAGHGGRDPGAVGSSGLMEKECTLYIAKKFGEILKSFGMIINQTREEDNYIGLSERAKIANDLNAKYFISVHVNSAEISSANGIEVFALGKGGEGEKLAKVTLDNLIKNLSLNDRGVKFANFAVLRETNMPSILVEIGFISNSNEEKLMKQDSFKDKVAYSLAKGFMQYLGKDIDNSVIDLKEDKINNATNDEAKVTVTDNDSKTSIISECKLSVNYAKQYVSDKGGSKEFIDIADLYWSLCSDCGGVNPLIAYAQAIHETGYGNFGGRIDASFKNPCGLKVTKGEDDMPLSHAKFNSWEDGVRAHMDHLALYAGAQGYPKADSKDPRHFAYLYGTAKFVEDLSYKWAPDKEYGANIVRIVREILSLSTENNIEIEDNSNIENVNIENNDKELINEVSLEYIREKVKGIDSNIDGAKNEINNLIKTINSLEVELNNQIKKNNELILENELLNKKVDSYTDMKKSIIEILNKD